MQRNSAEFEESIILTSNLPQRSQSQLISSSLTRTNIERSHSQPPSPFPAVDDYISIPSLTINPSSFHRTGSNNNIQKNIHAAALPSSREMKQPSGSSSSTTKLYGRGTPIPFGYDEEPGRSSGSSVVSSTPPNLTPVNPPSVVQQHSSSMVRNGSFGSGNNTPNRPSPQPSRNSPTRDEITNTSEWCPLTTQNHDQLFPLEGHTTFYWEQSLEDEDDSVGQTKSTPNNAIKLVVLFGGTGPIRGNTNQVYCMVPKHSGSTSSTSSSVSNNVNSNSSSGQQCKFQWVAPPTHYIPTYSPPGSTPVDDMSAGKKPNSSGNSSGSSNSDRTNSASSPRRSSLDILSYSEEGEIPLYKSRYDHTLVLCGNNKAYLFGGRNGMFSKTPIQDFILYSLDMNISNQFTWEIAHIPPKMERDHAFLKQYQNDLYSRESPLPRYSHACCAVNQKQSLLQSRTSSVGQSLAELNSESDSLSDLSVGGVMNNAESTNSSGASTGSTRFKSDGGVVLDCAMLLFGGVAITEYNSKKYKEVNDFWMFNCKERKWLSYPSIIQRYFKNSSSILESRTADDSNYMQEISLTSPSSASVSAANTGFAKKNISKSISSNSMSIHASFLPEARYGHQMCVVSNSLIFVIGGSTLGKETMYKDIWMLALNTFEWRKINLAHHKSNEKLIQKIPIRYASHVVVGRRILIYGGQLSYRSGDYLTEILCFDTETYRLSVIENSVSPQFNQGLVKATMLLYGMDLLIIGGKRGVNSMRFNDSVQRFSLKLQSIPQTNQKLLRENTKMKKPNQALDPNEMDMHQMEFFDDEEEEEFAASNIVKIQLISQILMSEMSSSDFSRKEALRYLAEVNQIDIVKQLFRDSSIYRALSIVMQSGSKSDIRLTSRVLVRYFKETDQGTLPFIIARQVLKFIESYLTLINSLIRLGEPIRQTLHMDYLNLFHLMCQNFEFYESLSKEIISVFHQCFKMHNPLCRASLDILQSTISSFLFLSLNAMHFSSKIDKDLCQTIRSFITQSEEAKEKARKDVGNLEMQGSILKLDELLMRLKEALVKLSTRSKTIKKQLGKLLKGQSDDDDDLDI